MEEKLSLVLPQDSHKLLFCSLPNVRFPINVIVKVDYIERTELNQLLFPSIKEVFYNEFSYTSDEENEIHKTFTGQYTVDFTHKINDSPKNIGLEIVKLCLKIINGDLDEFQPNWLFDRSIGYYLKAVVSQAIISFTKSSMVLTQSDRDWINLQIGNRDRVLFYASDNV